MVVDENFESGPDVYVVEQAEFDYSPARVFGRRIIPITADNLSPNADASWHARTIASMRSTLLAYRPGVDYVVPTGRPVRMMLIALLMRERGDVHKLLGWDNKQQRYFEYVLDLRDSRFLDRNNRIDRV